ncbi:hypothetical protein [Mycobacterium spongiae]|uniref:Uncharacterized protein n=1 Tax=Mycobacterium spongiae TaxID=886343 RepID=A0A975JZW2_9MYCO|nr:hypothetical protein [Mycobacterium spongiae]QUR68119.1 hypothetical protein F6B93_14395 [Mycobacterium spongiae]
MRTPLMIAVAVVAVAGLGAAAGLSLSSSRDAEPLAPIVVDAPDWTPPDTPPASLWEASGIPHPPPPENLDGICPRAAAGDQAR